MPKVSVIVPVYNAAEYVQASLRSVLEQTWDDFELIVIDDGSSDGSADLIRRMIGNDPRCHFRVRPNVGMARTLNEMLEMATGDLIARLDADDQALPDRFAKQVKFLDDHPECVLVGGGVINIDSDGDTLCTELYPSSHEEIEARMLSGGGGIIHPTVMMRRAPLVGVGGYATDCPVVEDQDLWLRLAMKGRLANLPEPLIRYRVHAGNMSFTGAEAAGRRLAEVLRRAHHDRGLSPPAIGPWVGVKIVDQWDRRREWAWSAIASGNRATARKHARRLLAERFWAKPAWSLLAYAYCPGVADAVRRLYRRAGDRSADA
jgi:glycosyltransferase involved in cell wall biosynthesis